MSDAVHMTTVRRTPEYYTWRGMMTRCFNDRFDAYQRYGGRGITVCERWQTFANFLEDMGQRPVGKTLDRYPDNNGNYEPGNCRWATAREQNANRRKPTAPRLRVKVERAPRQPRQPRQKTERRRVSQYAGLRTVKYKLKYSGCERASVRGVNVRKLTERELTEFREALDACVGERE